MRELPRMTEAQLRRARRLIRSLCANCDHGSCLLLDDGYDPCACPQMLTCSVLCRYFRTAVLPGDRELYREIMGMDHLPARRSAASPSCPGPPTPVTARTVLRGAPGGTSGPGRPKTGAERRKSEAGRPCISKGFFAANGAGHILSSRPPQMRLLFLHTTIYHPHTGGNFPPRVGAFLILTERSALWQRKAIPAARSA